MRVIIQLLVLPALVLALALLPEGMSSGSQPQGGCCKGQGPCQEQCRGQGKCACGKEGPMGKGRGKGMGKGMGKADHQADQATFHYLLSHRGEITRKVTRLANGVETLTESDSKEVAARIKEHVGAMYRRIEEGRPIHMRDPLFRAIFAHADKVKMSVEKTPKGVKVRETSDDPYVARLIQAHAEVVSKFLANGHAEVQKNHPVPPAPPEQ